MNEMNGEPSTNARACVILLASILSFSAIYFFLLPAICSNFPERIENRNDPDHYEVTFEIIRYL